MGDDDRSIAVFSSGESGEQLRLGVELGKYKMILWVQTLDAYNFGMAKPIATDLVPRESKVKYT